MVLGYYFSLCELITSFVKRFPLPDSESFWRIHSGYKREKYNQELGKKLTLVEYQVCIKAYYMPYPI